MNLLNVASQLIAYLFIEYVIYYSQALYLCYTINMINLNVQKQLNIILPNTNKALKEVIKDATKQELLNLSQNKDLKSIMNSLLTQTQESPSSDKVLLNLLKNNPTLKNLGSISGNIKALLQSVQSDKNPLPIEKQLKSFLVNIKDLSEPVLKDKIQNSGVFLESKLKNAQNPQVELKETLQTLTKELKSSKIFNVTVLNEKLTEILNTKPIATASNRALLQLLQENSKDLTQLGRTIKNVTKQLLEHQKNPANKVDIINSKTVVTQLGKLANFDTSAKLNPDYHVEKILKEDIKAILAKTTEQLSKSDHPQKAEILKNIDRLSLQIDYHQLLSHLSNSSSLYIPFEWDEMKEGQMSVKKEQEDKFTVDIDLKLQEYGELNLKLSLYENNQLNIKIYSNHQELKTVIKENIASLRSSLIENGITPREIRLLDKNRQEVFSPYEQSEQNIQVGFEVKA